MAASGLALLGFVIAHLLGNLTIYLGPEAINKYAQKLSDLGLLLWVSRFGLLAAVLVHAVTSVQLARENRAARPRRYEQFRPRQTTWAARTMMASGLLIVVYVVYHLLHFTFRVTNPDLSHGVDATGHHDVYAMMVLSFRIPLISLAYILGMAMVCLHLSHGIGSAPQTLGLNNERTLRLFGALGKAIALLLFLGYISIPIAVLIGVIPAPGIIR